MSTTRVKQTSLESIQELLAELLHADQAAGKLVLTHRGEISRHHYAQKLGYSPNYLGSIAKTTFKQFERNRFEILLTRARLLLQNSLKNKALRTQGVRVNRTWVLKTLGAPRREFENQPRLRKLVEEFDEIVASKKYLPTESESLTKRFTQLLNSDKCPLKADGLSVNGAELARQLAVLPSNLTDEGFISQIRDKNEKLSRGDHLLPGQTIVHKRVFDVRALLPAFGEQFIVRLSEAFKSYADTLHRGAPRERSIAKRLFTHTAQGSAMHAQQVRRALNEGRHPDPASWQKCIDDFLQEMERNFSPQQHSNKYQEHRALGRLLRHFASVGLTPTLYKPTQQHRASRGRQWRTTTKTIAEVIRQPSESSQDSVSSQVRALAQDILTNALDPEEFDEPETVQFLTVLEQEAVAIDSLLPQDVPTAVLMIVNRRLDLISAAATSIISEAKQLLEQGTKLLAAATLARDSLQELDALNDPYLQKQVVDRWFPVLTTEDNIRLSKANLLSISVIKLHGVLPSQRHAHRELAPYIGIKRLVSLTTRLGGRGNLNALLTPTSAAVAATVTHHLCKSGENIAVSLSFLKDCLQASATRGFIETKSNKDRAGGKAIFNEFRRNSDVHRNLEWIREATSRISELAAPHERENLFNVVKGPSAGTLTQHQLRAEFKQLIASTPNLQDLKLLPNMLRRSVILKASLETRGTARVARAAANHSLKQSQAYTNTMPVRLQRELGMLEFIRYYESVVLIEAAHLVPLVGHSDEDIARRHKSLSSTGLGTMCRDPLQKPGNEGKQCGDPTSCAKDKCPQLVIRLYPIEVARMQLWKPALLEAEGEWERDRPERWRATWLPWLCLIIVVERKASRGAFLEAWDMGTELREEMERQPNFRGPQPW